MLVTSRDARDVLAAAATYWNDAVVGVSLPPCLSDVSRLTTDNNNAADASNRTSPPAVATADASGPDSRCDNEAVVAVYRRLRRLFTRVNSSVTALRNALQNVTSMMDDVEMIAGSSLSHPHTSSFMSSGAPLSISTSTTSTSSASALMSSSRSIPSLVGDTAGSPQMRDIWIRTRLSYAIHWLEQLLDDVSCARACIDERLSASSTTKANTSSSPSTSMHATMSSLSTWTQLRALCKRLNGLHCRLNEWVRSVASRTMTTSSLPSPSSLIESSRAISASCFRDSEDVLSSFPSLF